MIVGSLTVTYTPQSQTSSDDLDLLSDGDPTTCVNFAGGTSLPAHVEINYVFNEDLATTVYMYGSDLGCTEGGNSRLYVVPITATNTGDRLGMVRVCALEKRIGDESREACIFACNHTSGDLEAVRVIQRSVVNPPTAWSLCDISGKYYQ